MAGTLATEYAAEPPHSGLHIYVICLLDLHNPFQ
jgi:hypothetical protein